MAPAAPLHPWRLLAAAATTRPPRSPDPWPGAAAWSYLPDAPGAIEAADRKPGRQVGLRVVGATSPGPSSAPRVKGRARIEGGASFLVDDVLTRRGWPRRRPARGRCKAGRRRSRRPRRGRPGARTLRHRYMTVSFRGSVMQPVTIYTRPFCPYCSPRRERYCSTPRAPRSPRSTPATIRPCAAR